MTIQELDQLIEEGNSLKQIAQAYSEIAVLKLKKIRGMLDRNRVFFNEISAVYGLVKSFALKKGLIVPKPKKRVSIILTSNFRFSGTISSSLIEFFTSSTKTLDTDRILIGKTAADHFKFNPMFSGSQTILLSSDQPTPQELINLVALIKDYHQVLVFYPRLKSLLVQRNTATDITATSLPTRKEDSTIGFIFEPEIPKILAFFDQSILTLLLEGTFLEAEVAWTAARFISMDQAETEANKFIKEQERLKSFAKKDLLNKQILESYAATLAVGKEAF